MRRYEHYIVDNWSIFTLHIQKSLQIILDFCRRCIPIVLWLHMDKERSQFQPIHHQRHLSSVLHHRVSSPCFDELFEVVERIKHDDCYHDWVCSSEVKISLTLHLNPTYLRWIFEKVEIRDANTQISKQEYCWYFRQISDESDIKKSF